MKGNSNYGRARGDGHQEAGASQSRWATASVGELMGKREFNMLFLLAAQCYPPKIARQLIRDCREDIKTLGWDHAQRKWARFVEKAQGGEEAR